MPTSNKMTVFSVDNGDTVLITAHGIRVLTDINYRQAAADEDDETLDFAKEIRDACSDGHLDVFVLTHPDEDHSRGFDKIFHVGPRSEWKYDPNDDDRKILVNEIWCSSYAANPNYTTDDSKPLLREIKRRKNLAGDTGDDEDGNRLEILHAEDEQELSKSFQGKVLAPNESEVEIGRKKIDDKWPSSNPTSLVINWTIVVSDTASRVMLGGDAPVEIWERLHDEKYEDEQGDLAWHILVAPHHCSRYTLGRKNLETDEFEWSEKAEKALGVQRGNGWIVSSSKKIKRNDDDPPSWSAKQRYLKILANGNEITEEEKERFLCTGGDDDESDPHHISFEFGSSGPVRKIKGTTSAAVISAVAGGGSYGRDEH